MPLTLATSCSLRAGGEGLWKFCNLSDPELVAGLLSDRHPVDWWELGEPKERFERVIGASICAIAADFVINLAEWIALLSGRRIARKRNAG